jgi:NAD(P)-dependent dehydrogenase (short-subunit alcohol dehydrogenase family)
MGRLDGKIAVITGAARGIGLAAAKLFVGEGARVLMVDLDEGPLRRAAKEVGEAASDFVADVTDASQVEAYVRTAGERYGGFDVLLANAGIEGPVKPIAEYPIDVFDRVIAVNVRGAWLGVRTAIPVMQKRGGGSIIITSSIAGVKGGIPGISAYVTSKHAVIGLMRNAALECAPLGIRVNTVTPAPIETRMMRQLEEGMIPGGGGQAKEAVAAMIPMHRYGTPDEVARTMLFLASEDSRYCSGGIYLVDGGMSVM